MAPAPVEAQMDVEDLTALPPLEQVLAPRLDIVQPAPVEGHRRRGEAALHHVGGQTVPGQLPALLEGVAVDGVAFGHGGSLAG